MAQYETNKDGAHVLIAPQSTWGVHPGKYPYNDTTVTIEVGHGDGSVRFDMTREDAVKFAQDILDTVQVRLVPR